MPDFIYRANIDHCLQLLDDPDLAVEKRAMVLKLLIEEEDKLSHYYEQLEFAEVRLAQSHERLNHLRDLRESFADGSEDHKRAGRVLENAKEQHRLLYQFCHRMRMRAGSRGI